MNLFFILFGILILIYYGFFFWLCEYERHNQGWEVWSLWDAMERFVIRVYKKIKGLFF